ncbi:CBS domain-containing protein [Falsiroseomonas sp.]|uniref:CBS domain-containing protein n=1 Tax=Falsiroseomonas sp. TaxID=2870721 RepID=UPI003563EFDB
MIAGDLMTRDVVAVPPDMAVATVARVLAEAGISAVPVTDEANRLLGVVAELDLIRRLAERDKAPPGWLASLFADERALAERYARTHGLRARDVMTREVTTVPEDATADHLARLMEERNVRSVPVVGADGTLRGIVSRADLLLALLTPGRHGATAVDDARLRRSITEALRRQPWADVHYLTVEVENGIVRLHGFHTSPEAQRAVRVLIEGIEGVRSVEDDSRPWRPTYAYGIGGTL